MILVNKEEAAAIRKSFPYCALVRTCKQRSKRGRYYCEERPDVLSFLSKYRKRGAVHVS